MKTMISRILQKSMEYLEKQCPDGETEGEEVSEIFQYIRANREDPDLCVKTVALHFNLTVSNLSHRVKKLTGRNISDYITEVRMDYAHELLKNTDFSIQTISTMLGYSQASGFVTKFKKYYSVTPAEYRKKVKGDG